MLVTGLSPRRIRVLKQGLDARAWKDGAAELQAGVVRAVHGDACQAALPSAQLRPTNLALHEPADAVVAKEVPLLAAEVAQRLVVEASDADTDGGRRRWRKSRRKNPAAKNFHSMRRSRERCAPRLGGGAQTPPPVIR